MLTGPPPKFHGTRDILPLAGVPRLSHWNLGIGGGGGRLGRPQRMAAGSASDLTRGLRNQPRPPQHRVYTGAQLLVASQPTKNIG
jgi:hypothetical protein